MMASSNPAVIQTRGLSKRYRKVTALTEATITVPEGRISALIGPNGAGKTTLLRLLAGLARPTGGEVAVLGGTPRQDPAFLAESASWLRRSRCTGACPPRITSLPARTSTPAGTGCLSGTGWRAWAFRSTRRWARCPGASAPSWRCH